jgi:hypothetical protein
MKRIGACALSNCDKLTIIEFGSMSGCAETGTSAFVPSGLVAFGKPWHLRDFVT